MGEKLSCFEFGRQLIEAGDLDPTYVCILEADLPTTQLCKWLVSYFCFYHMGTASWISELTDDPTDSQFWARMSTAAESKDYPRSSERRHFRAANAIKSVAWLRERGLNNLMEQLVNPCNPINTHLNSVMDYVQSWNGFGPWISFKVADMVERLGLCNVRFPTHEVAAQLFDSPLEGALLLHREILPDKPEPPYNMRKLTAQWSIDQICAHIAGTRPNPNKIRGVRAIKAYKEAGMGQILAPPRYERAIGPQEAETILCKWHGYLKGHYHIGEDVAAAKEALLRFGRCKVAQKLLQGGRIGGLW